jgi:uncharacterized protein YcfJ
LVGIVAGVGIAVAGGVAGITLMNGSDDGAQVVAEELETGSAEVIEAAPQAQATTANAAPALRSAPAAPAEPKMVEECWDEEVEVPAEARDDKAIAGTAAGAVIGGALADRLGDDDLVTAAGAAAGAFLGRKAQREFQENRTTTETVRRCRMVAAR